MKRILAFIFVLISFGLNSQTNIYHHFPGTNSGAFWRTDWSDGAFCMELSAVYQYYYANDTVIGSENYHRVMKSGAMVGGCYYGTPFGYQGAIREDSASRKILIILPNHTNENILYDFNLGIGDTLTTIQDSLFNGFHCFTVGSIDSVLVGTSYRKKWTLSSQCYSPFDIIEGIGSLGGLIDPLGVFENGAMLLCYSDTGVHYDNPSWWDEWGCDTVFQSVEEILDRIVFKLSPVPADDQLQLHFNSMARIPIVVTDESGRIILLGEIEDGKEINTSSWSEGVYFISSRNEFHPQKFVVIH